MPYSIDDTTASRITVSTPSGSYPICIGDRWLATIDRPLQEQLEGLTHAAIICDSAIRDTWAATVEDSLRSAGIAVELCEVPSGEGTKSPDQLVRLWNWLLECRADRRTALVAVGGGVVGDLAGFAAATFTRGIDLVQVPTTLLAQVDSSVGGKTGINLPGAKNIVGAFWQPRLVAIDTQTLSTLPDREYLSGLAEVVKYGVIMDAEFFAYLETHAAALAARAPGPLRSAIARSCQLKAEVVAQDERETSGRRAILNYGHTFAHAIEATAGYGRFLHGEAVAIGMQMAARLARDLGRIGEEVLLRQGELLSRFELPLEWPGADPDAMIAAMMSDKKVAHGKLRLVLPSRLGEVELVDSVPPEAIRAAIG